MAGVIVALVISYSAYYQVNEGQAAVVTRFGAPVREVRDAGFYWKLPAPIDRVRLIDLRRRLFNTPFSATFTRDRKNVILLSYVVWRVQNPLLFLQSVGDRETAQQKISGMATAMKNFHIGAFELSALVSTDPKNIRTAEIEDAILKDVREDALKKFGIEIEQVGIKRIAYPEENVAAVLQQMKAERIAEADRLRAEGKKEASRIRNEALVNSEVILREGLEEAGRIRGDAEKEAARVYSRAHDLDPEFYKYWRQLRAIRKTLGAKSTVILRTDQGFFDVLGGPTHPNRPARSTEEEARASGPLIEGGVHP